MAAPDPTQPTPAGAHPRPGPRGVRWWPAGTILFLAGVAVAGVWAATGANHQLRNLRTMAVGVVAGVLLVLWSQLYSRLSGRTKLAVLGGVLGLVGTVAGLVRIRGVTGDLIPILQWRWVEGTQPTGPAVTLPVQPAGAPGPAGLAGDAYPQFLGPDRDAIVTGIHLASDWRSHPPRQLWRHAVGAGWSGFAVKGPYAVTQEQRGPAEAVVCYQLLTGQPIWAHADPAHYSTTLAGEGPRATPTIAGDRVVAQGATGLLNCLDLKTGRLLWSTNILEANGSRLPEWGVSCSPLVWNHWVIVSPGGRNERSLVAYDIDSGRFVWGGGEDGAGYSSPCLATLDGVRQVLIFDGGGVSGHAATTGQVLWRYPWPGGHPHVAMPVVLGTDRVLISSGYGTGSEVVRVSGGPTTPWRAVRLWKSLRLKAKFTNVVQKNGYIYGLDDGILVCLDAATGQLRWKGERYGHGQMILADDLLLVTVESGAIALVDPQPQAFRELARLTVFDRKTWNPPALAGPYLLVRNDAEAALYRLPLRGE